MMASPVFDTAVPERSPRRIWVDVVTGLAAFGWALSVAALVLARDLADAALTAAGVLTSVAVFVAIASACQRTNARNNERILELVTAQHEDVLRRLRSMSDWMDSMSGTVRDMGEHLPGALRDHRWKGYADATEDLSAKVVELREFQTGDLSRHLHGGRG